MATQQQKDLGAQAIALAEQLGRIAGTIEGTAESWLQRQKLADQLTRVRDSATQMLETLTDGAERGRDVATAVVRKVPASAKASAGLAKARAYLASAGARLQPDRGSADKNPAPRMAQPDPARAPGKKRRKPGPTLKGVKKSDEKIPKLRTAEAARQRRKSHA